MAIANIGFTATKAGIVPLASFNDTTVLRLRVRDAGKYVVFGRVVIHNSDGDSQNASARLTTLDGATELDRVDTRLEGGGDADSQSIALQGTLTLNLKTENDVVDIRCATYNGAALEATLIAILVDNLEPAGV